MLVSTLVSYSLLCLAIELTPGPNMAFLAILSISQGKRAGFIAVAGIAFGLASVASLAAMGVAELVQNVPALAHGLTILGAGYLVWLAYATWREGETPIDILGKQRISQVRYFRQGFITNVLNVKAFLFYAMVLPAFVGASEHRFVVALVLVAISVTIATFIHLSVVVLANQWAANLRKPERLKTLRRVMALLLVAVAFWFGWVNVSLGRH